MITRTMEPEAYTYALDTLGRSFETARRIPRLSTKRPKHAARVFTAHGTATYFHRTIVKGVIRAPQG